MARVQVCAPEIDDMRHIAGNLRAADLSELQATRGDDLDVLACLVHAVRSSSEAFVAVTACGEPIAVFGVAAISVLTGHGCPWMLGTGTMDRYGREIVTLSRAHVARWNVQYPLLFNYVDARNVRSIAWLKRTGFALDDALPYGLKGDLFRRFSRGTHNP